MTLRRTLVGTLLVLLCAALVTRQRRGAMLRAYAPVPHVATAETLARSLAGTAPDGILRADTRGDFVADVAARRYFDYMLLSEGERPLSQIAADVQARLQADLPALAARQALDLWQRFLSMRTSLAATTLGDNPAALVQAKLAYYFTPREQTDFFADMQAPLQQARAAWHVVRQTDPGSPARAQAFDNLRAHGPYNAAQFAGMSLGAAELAQAARGFLQHGDACAWQRLRHRYHVNDATAQRILDAMR